MKRFIDYNKNLKERAKYLQENMTKPEKKLRFDFFKKLGKIPPTPLNKGDSEDCKKNIPLTKGEAENQGMRIYKQKQIQNFIVDFYIPRLKLVIEIDGESHFDEYGKVYDGERSQILEGLGLKVVRFTNEEVMKNFDGVVRELEKYFDF